MSLLNYFSSSVKFRLCEVMVDYFGREDKFADEYLIQTVLSIARALHDKVDAQCSQEEKERISKKIKKLIYKIDFGKDLEKQLKVYTEARGMFQSLDDVMESLVHASLGLAMRANRIVRGKHNKKTLGFVKACVAYAHITIPSLHSTKNRASLFLNTSRVAMVNGLISEAESILKANLLTLNSQYKGHTSIEEDQILASHLLNTLGQLVVMPSNPEKYYFEMAGIVFNIVRKKEWNAEMLYERVNVMVGILNYIGTQVQDRLPYKINRVDSNDDIFLGDEGFTTDALKMF